MVNEGVELHRGEIVAGWTVEQRIGAGATSIVYRATRGGVVGALKVFTPTVVSSEKAMARVRLQLERLPHIRHPNVCALIEGSADSDKPYVVMEYVEGQSLSGHVNRYGVQSLEFLKRSGLQLASALEALHSAGLVHRDVKPTNVLVDNNADRVVLTDFGVMQADGSDLTSTGEFLGTWHYAAPEQWTDAAGEGWRTAVDVYGLGGTLLLAATRHGPFPGTANLGQLITAVTTQPPRVDVVGPQSVLAPLLRRMLLRNPSQRPTLGEVARELDELGETAKVAAEPTDVLTRLLNTAPDVLNAYEEQRLRHLRNEAIGRHYGMLDAQLDRAIERIRARVPFRFIGRHEGHGMPDKWDNADELEARFPDLVDRRRSSVLVVGVDAKHGGAIWSVWKGEPPVFEVVLFVAERRNRSDGGGRVLLESARYFSGSTEEIRECVESVLPELESELLALVARINS